MKHIIKTEADWLEIRKKYITASNAAVLVGADPYTSPGALRNPAPFFGNAYTRVGQMLEPVVVNVVNDVLGLSGASRFVLYENPEGHKEFYTEGHLGATPDAHRDRLILLECKTTRPHTFLKYGVVPPSKYLIQLLVQMMCTELDEGLLAIMSTNLTQATAELHWPIKIFKMWKDDRICDIIKEEAERYVNNTTFRVNSKVKQRIKILLSLSYQEVI